MNIGVSKTPKVKIKIEISKENDPIRFLNIVTMVPSPLTIKIYKMH